MWLSSRSGPLLPSRVDYSRPWAATRVVPRQPAMNSGAGGGQRLTENAEMALRQPAIEYGAATVSYLLGMLFGTL